MKILNLIIENVKRVEVVEITPDPDGSLIVIGGNNEQGKTSVLDAIQMGLGGMKGAPVKPVRAGKKVAEIVLDMGGLKIRRVIKPGGGGSITVSDESGKLASPQAILDSLLGRLAFDPLAFSRMDGRKQAEQVRELVGIDFTELDSERKALVEERAEANREVKRLKGSLDSLVHHQDVAKSVDLRAAMDEISEMRETNRKHGDLSQTYDKANEEHIRAQEARDDAVLDVDQCKEALLKAEREAGLMAQKFADAGHRARAAKKKVDDAPFIPVNTICEAEEGLQGAQAQNLRANDHARDNARYTETTAELAAAEKTHRGRESDLRRLDEKREEILAGAKFPLEGLGFDENGVTLKGVPFGQASAAEALKASLAMGLAMNKKIKVILIRDGSLLDDESLKTVAEMAAAADAQVWMERVGKGEECSVIIEDGQTVEEAE